MTTILYKQPYNYCVFVNDLKTLKDDLAHILGLNEKDFLNSMNKFSINYF